MSDIIVKCPVCMAEGKKSTAIINYQTSTLLYYNLGYYDEEGKYHINENPNTTTTALTCSNGHNFIITNK